LAGAVVTPGFAQPRSKLPWLPYESLDRVIINAHNFTQTYLYPSLRDAIAGYYARRDTGAAATDRFTTDGSQDGTLGGSATRVDDGGLAYSIGATGEINCGDVIGDVGTGPLSVGLWVKGGSSARGIVTKGLYGPDGSDNGLFVYTRNLSAAPYAYWNGYTSYEFGANNGAWHHIGFSRESNATNKLKLYYDGTLVVTGTEARTLSNSVAFRLGKFSDTSGFNGLIDDFVAYHRVLTATEFSQLASQRGAAYA
jgi:hypothetical protein